MIEIQENIPLAPYTTFGIGGPARYFVRVSSLEELREALAFAKERALPAVVIGGGSNLLVNDSGIDSVVIKIELMGVEQDGDTVVAAAGETWDALVARVVDAGLWGVENLSGIPGTVGAAPVQNIGAYGCEVKDTLAWVEALDTTTNEVVRLSNAECGFAYRTSMFKRAPGRYAIVRVAFTLSTQGGPNATYKDLAGMEHASLAEIRAKVLAVRAGKFPNLAVEGTAGSFFLNPVVPAATATRLLAQYPQMPQFAAPGGLPDGKAGVKLSLAWVLDNVLHLKGASVGGARLYEMQPLVIAAARNTPATDVRALATMVTKKIKEELDIEIEREVREM